MGAGASGRDRLAKIDIRPATAGDVRPGIYLEDLYVRPELRGRGVGGALMRHLARLALERGCRRLEWTVLDWNEPALAFYRSIGAKPVEGWTVHLLAGDALTKLAAR